MKTKDTAESLSKELMVLRDRTMLTGDVYEIQTQHLYLWASLVLDFCQDQEVRVNTKTQRCLFVGTGASMVPSDLSKRIEGLEEAVRFLFGAPWRLGIAVDGNLLYDGRDRDKELDGSGNITRRPS